MWLRRSRNMLHHRWRTVQRPLFEQSYVDGGHDAPPDEIWREFDVRIMAHPDARAAARAFEIRLPVRALSGLGIHEEQHPRRRRDARTGQWKLRLRSSFATPSAVTPGQKHYCGYRSGCLRRSVWCSRPCCWRAQLAAPALKSACSGSSKGYGRARQWRWPRCGEWR